MSVDPVSAFPARPSPAAAGARLGELYAEHARMVYGVCRMLLRDPDEAEDATQQVFLSAYRSLLTGTDVRDPAAWLGTISRNECRRRAAGRMRTPLATSDESTLVSPAAEDAAIGREDAAALYAQLAGLPEKQREAVVLRDVYGLRYDEVAKALGTSRPAVEALLFRGRRRLQRRLRPDLVAGILVVPLAIRDSIAYAVPGFAGAAAPAGAAAAAAGIPLAAKLAAAGTAVAIAGSAGVVAERSLHDPPARPPATAVAPSEPAASAVRSTTPRTLLPLPAGGFPQLARTDDDHSGPGRGMHPGAAADEDEKDAEDGERGRGDESREADREDTSGPGGAGGSEDRGRERDEEPEAEEPKADEHEVEQKEPQASEEAERSDEGSGSSGKGSGGDEDDGEGEAETGENGPSGPGG